MRRPPHDVRASLPLLTAVCRYRFAILAVLALLMGVGSASQLLGANDWEYFAWGSDALFGERRPFVWGSFAADTSQAGGLHLYANYGFLQIGPPALLLAKALQVGPQDGIFVAGALVQGLGLLAVWCVDRGFRESGRHVPLAVLVGGGLTTVVWGSLTHYTHLDDALALAAVAGALLALRADRWLQAGLLLGLAAASKPWAVVAAALVLVAPGLRARLVASGATAGVVALFWGPFVLADPRTLALAEFHLPAAAEAPLSVLGLGEAAAMPGLRVAQFAAGLLVVTLVVMRGRWQAALLAGFATRLLLDPSAYQYYAAGIALTALVADLGSRRSRFPAFTAVATAGWLGAQVAQSEVLAGWIRAATYLALIGGVFALTLIRRRNPTDQAAEAPARRTELCPITATAPS